MCDLEIEFIKQRHFFVFITLQTRCSLHCHIPVNRG